MSKSTNKESKQNYIIGYVDAIKVGKIISIPEKNIVLQSIEKDKEFNIKLGLFGVFKKKETTHFKVYENKECIKDRLKQSIKASIENAFTHAITQGKASEKERLAFLTIKAMNIVSDSTTLLVKVKFNKKQEPVIYADNIQLMRESRYSGVEMKMAFQTHLPEIYANVKEIQEFPNNEMSLLFLEKEEEELMKMIKGWWKVIPAKDVKLLHSIQQKIQAFKDLQ